MATKTYKEYNGTSCRCLGHKHSTTGIKRFQHVSQWRMKENIGRTPNTITYLNHLIMKISKLIHIRTRIKTVPVSLVSIMCSKDSEETTVPIRMEKEKYYVSSLLNSLFNNDVHTKQIHKRITNKMVPISIVFYCVFEKYRTENVCIRMEEKQILWGNCCIITTYVNMW